MKNFKDWWNGSGFSIGMHESEESWDFQQEKIDELESRIEKALKELDRAWPESWGDCVESAIETLKGE